MEIVFTDEELSLKDPLKSETCSEEIQRFAKKEEMVQITCRITDELTANTILNLLFNMSSDDESPIGLEMVSIATDANCITENTKKELIGLLDKCKAIITGDRTKELEEIAGTIGRLGEMVSGISFPGQFPVETEGVTCTSQCASYEISKGEDENE